MDQEQIDQATDDVVAAVPDGVDAVLAVVAPYSRADASAILDRAINEFVSEFNRVLAVGGQPFGVDGSTFMARYGLIWQVKQYLNSRP